MSCLVQTNSLKSQKYSICYSKKKRGTYSHLEPERKLKLGWFLKIGEKCCFQGEPAIARISHQRTDRITMKRFDHVTPGPIVLLGAAQCRDLTLHNTHCSSSSSSYTQECLETVWKQEITGEWPKLQEELGWWERWSFCKALKWCCKTVQLWSNFTLKWESREKKEPFATVCVESPPACHFAIHKVSNILSHNLYFATFFCTNLSKQNL